MQFAVSHHATSQLVKGVFQSLPVKLRNGVENEIGAVTDTKLVTAVRPFMFGGRVIHELYFDPDKLLFFTMREKIGAVLSALIIAELADKQSVALSDNVEDRSNLILREAKRLKYGRQVSAFLRRIKTLEAEWRESTAG